MIIPDTANGRHRRAGIALGSWLLVLAGLLGSLTAQAQSGPYGNEWIVPSQPYYKVKIWRDGLYRLDYAYLSKLGAGAVAPTQLQVWRRGKEVAVYQGGNAATLDNSTYLEFYGQRNDGQLDREFYKDSRNQANPHFSYYTDTAAYFVTWGSRAGRRMAQPTATGGTPHGWRLQSVLTQKTGTYAENNGREKVFLPWIESGEGFFEGFNYGQNHAPLDSVLRAISTAAGAPAPLLDATVVGGSDTDHSINIGVIPPGGTPKVLGTVQFNLFAFRRARYQFAFSDISATGGVEVNFDVVSRAHTGLSDVWRFGWWRVTVPQQNVWFSNRRQLWFQNDSLLAGPATYEVDNIPATVRGYDVEDPWNVQRIEPTAATTLGSTGRRYVFPSATMQQTRHLLLADEAQVAVPALPARRVYFRTIDPVKPTFIVITHPKLMAPAGGVANPAKAYAAYRASVAGGRYDTLMVTAPQLYDQFHYGERSVIGLRHFALWLAANKTASQTKYLLLLGKAISPGTQVTANSGPAVDVGFGQSTAASTRTQGEYGLDLVPISTRSPSDNFLSSDWPHDRYEAALPTGRVSATAPQEVVDYLAKLQDYESQLDPNTPNPEPWHKSVVHLAGGESLSDFQQFGDYLDHYKRRIEHPLLGGQVTTFKRTILLGTVNINISPQVNAGLTLISYFGHGSTTVFDLNPGDITDPASGYANIHKYPVLMFNGCFAGFCSLNSRTFATDWLLAPSKGSIGMMAESGLSYAYQLNLAQDLFTQLLFNDPAWFGKPIAEVHAEVVRRLETTTDFKGIDASTEQLLSTIWQGDPALRFFAPSKPDLVASGAKLALAPIAPDQAVTAASKQFVLNIGVSNPARITRDSVEIRVTRTYARGSGRSDDVYVYNNHLHNYLAAGTQVLDKPFPQSFQRDTTYQITLPNTGEVFGENTFKVELDYRNKVAELDETNNTATLSYSFLKGGVTLLVPTEFAITPSNTPRLVAQTNDATGTTRGYDFQVDSVATFDSRALQQVAGLQAGVVASWVPKPLLAAAGRDSVVWYWRVRFTSPTALEDKDWKLSSFRVIPKATLGGWSQSHYAQFGRDQLQNVAVAKPSGHWSFPDQQMPIRLRTTGGGAAGSGPTFGLLGGYGILTNLLAPSYVGLCAINSPNLLVVVLDQHSLKRLTIAGSYSTCGQADQSFYHFGNDNDQSDNLNNSAARRTQLLTLLQNVPDGAYVALITENRLLFSTPELAPVLQQMATLLGSKLALQLKDGEPWALVAQKRSTGGRALAEAGPDRSIATAGYSQTLDLTYALTTPGQAGSVTSTLIGPAQKWGTLYNTVRHENTTGTHKLVLSGIDNAGKATVLNANVGHGPVDLSKYPTATYPYMQLQLSLADSVNRVAPQLKQWLVTYQGLPEGVVRRDLVASSAYDPATLAKHATDKGELNFRVRFDNVSTEAFPKRLQAQVKLLDANGNVAKYPNGTAVQQLVTAPHDLAANDTLTLAVHLSVVGVFGTFTTQVVVNPQLLQLQPELFYFNNELNLAPYTVGNTNVPPTLDVAVDGRHILNGELVSPTPVITIQLKDDDKFRHITDPSYFSVYLLKPGQTTATPVDVNGSQVHFSVDNTSGTSLAKLEYQPGLLPTGVYTLRVQGHDPANATAGTQDYQVKFEVVQASQITNVFPYPNPVTSKAKFVFTVTGTELPRNMKIQIMTLTGKVVREIFMGELGPLHIGNNITDYAWDGTDQYGDRLANGTYLYRVAIDDPDGKFSKRTTAGDQAFKNDWGKLVLLR